MITRPVQVKNVAVPKLDLRQLLPPLRLYLKSDPNVRGWKIRAISRIRNPLNGGVFLVSGGDDRTPLGAWSLILKVIKPPDHFGTSSTTSLHYGDWNYWRREELVYRSKNLKLLPTGFRKPRCLGIVEQEDDSVWLWLEKVDGLRSDAWTLQVYADVACFLGRLNALYARQELLSDPWLSRNLLRQWCHRFILEESVPEWEEFFVKSLWKLPSADVFLDVLKHYDGILKALEGLPQIFCHRDASSQNIFVHMDESAMTGITAIDWALSGIGPVGEDLGPLAFSAVQQLSHINSANILDALFKSYLKGLEEYGFRPDPQSIRFCMTVSTALRTGLWMIYLLRCSMKRSRFLDTGNQEGVVKLDEFAIRMFSFVFNLSRDVMSAYRCSYF